MITLIAKSVPGNQYDTNLLINDIITSGYRNFRCEIKKGDECKNETKQVQLVAILQSMGGDFRNGRKGDTVFLHLAPQGRLVDSKISRRLDPVAAVLAQYLHDRDCLGLL